MLSRSLDLDKEIQFGFIRIRSIPGSQVCFEEWWPRHRWEGFVYWVGIKAAYPQALTFTSTLLRLLTFLFNPSITTHPFEISSQLPHSAQGMSCLLHAPITQRSLKRKLESLDSDLQTGHETACEVVSTYLPILRWLGDTRSKSTPPEEPQSERSERSEQYPGSRRSSSVPPIKMSTRTKQSTTLVPSEKASKSNSSGTASRFYRETLHGNGIRLDLAGWLQPDDIKKFVKRHITKGRSSPPWVKPSWTLC